MTIPFARYQSLGISSSPLLLPQSARPEVSSIYFEPHTLAFISIQSLLAQTVLFINQFDFFSVGSLGLKVFFVIRTREKEKRVASENLDCAGDSASTRKSVFERTHPPPFDAYNEPPNVAGRLLIRVLGKVLVASARASTR